MKPRIVIIILCGVVTLLIFEIWRYRASNHDFKALYEVARSRAAAMEQTQFPVNEMMRELLRSETSARGSLRFERLRLSYGNPTARPVDAEPSVTIDFKSEGEITGSDRERIEAVLQAVDSKYEQAAPGIWRVRHDFAGDEFRVYVFANFPVSDARFSKHPEQ